MGAWDQRKNDKKEEYTGPERGPREHHGLGADRGVGEAVGKETCTPGWRREEPYA